MEGLITEAPVRQPIFERLSALADPTRCRLLLALEEHELTVSELCSILQLPQSTASRHLKVLADDGWIGARREGTSRLYAAEPRRESDARRLWALVREQVAEGAAAEEDRRRLASVLAGRRTRSREFFSSAAGEWARLRGELFGERFDLLALMGLLDPRWRVGDLGCGTGLLTASMAPFVRHVTAIDDSEAMLAAARTRLEGAENVELRRGRLEELPLADDELDAATLVLVLHHLPEPERAIAEAARTLKPGGRLLVADMLPHERDEYRKEMGHVWLGFPAGQIESWLARAGFTEIRIRPLPADPDAQGPTLFAAGAIKAESGAPETTDSQPAAERG